MEFEVFITKQIEECKARLITLYHRYNSLPEYNSSMTLDAIKSRRSELYCIQRELTEIQTRHKTLKEV